MNITLSDANDKSRDINSDVPLPNSPSQQGGNSSRSRFIINVNVSPSFSGATISSSRAFPNMLVASRNQAISQTLQNLLAEDPYTFVRCAGPEFATALMQYARNNQHPDKLVSQGRRAGQERNLSDNSHLSILNSALDPVFMPEISLYRPKHSPILTEWKTPTSTTDSSSTAASQDAAARPRTEFLFRISRLCGLMVYTCQNSAAYTSNDLIHAWNNAVTATAHTRATTAADGAHTKPLGAASMGAGGMAALKGDEQRGGVSTGAAMAMGDGKGAGASEQVPMNVFTPLLASVTQLMQTIHTGTGHGGNSSSENMGNTTFRTGVDNLEDTSRGSCVVSTGKSTSQRTRTTNNQKKMKNQDNSSFTSPDSHSRSNIPNTSRSGATGTAGTGTSAGAGAEVFAPAKALMQHVIAACDNDDKDKDAYDVLIHAAARSTQRQKARARGRGGSTSDGDGRGYDDDEEEEDEESLGARREARAALGMSGKKGRGARGRGRKTRASDGLYYHEDSEDGDSGDDDEGSDGDFSNDDNNDTIFGTGAGMGISRTLGKAAEAILYNTSNGGSSGNNSNSGGTSVGSGNAGSASIGSGPEVSKQEKDVIAAAIASFVASNSLATTNADKSGKGDNINTVGVGVSAGTTTDMSMGMGLATGTILPSSSSSSSSPSTLASLSPLSFPLPHPTLTLTIIVLTHFARRITAARVCDGLVTTANLKEHTSHGDPGNGNKENSGVSGISSLGKTTSGFPTPNTADGVRNANRNMNRNGTVVFSQIMSSFRTTLSRQTSEDVMVVYADNCIPLHLLLKEDMYDDSDSFHPLGILPGGKVRNSGQGGLSGSFSGEYDDEYLHLVDLRMQQQEHQQHQQHQHQPYAHTSSSSPSSPSASFSIPATPSASTSISISTAPAPSISLASLSPSLSASGLLSPRIHTPNSGATADTRTRNLLNSNQHSQFSIPAPVPLHPQYLYPNMHQIFLNHTSDSRLSGILGVPEASSSFPQFSLPSKTPESGKIPIVSLSSHGIGPQAVYELCAMLEWQMEVLHAWAAGKIPPMIGKYKKSREEEQLQQQSLPDSQENIDESEISEEILNSGMSYQPYCDKDVESLFLRSTGGLSRTREPFLFYHNDNVPLVEAIFGMGTTAVYNTGTGTGAGAGAAAMKGTTSSSTSSTSTSTSTCTSAASSSGCSVALPPPRLSLPILYSLNKLPSYLYPFTRIDLSGNPLGNSGLITLSQSIPYLPFLTYLNISGTGASSLGLSAVFTALHGHPSIRHLDVSSHAAAGSVSLGPDTVAAFALAVLLMRTRTLQTLLLRDVGLGLIKYACALLCVGLAHNASLHTLDISRNYLTARHVQMLCGALTTQRRNMMKFAAYATACATRVSSYTTQRPGGNNIQNNAAPQRPEGHGIGQRTTIRPTAGTGAATGAGTGVNTTRGKVSTTSAQNEVSSASSTSSSTRKLSTTASATVTTANNTTAAAAVTGSGLGTDTASSSFSSAAATAFSFTYSTAPAAVLSLGGNDAMACLNGGMGSGGKGNGTTGNNSGISRFGRTGGLGGFENNPGVGGGMFRNPENSGNSPSSRISNDIRASLPLSTTLLLCSHTQQQQVHQFALSLAYNTLSRASHTHAPSSFGGALQHTPRQPYSGNNDTYSQNCDSYSVTSDAPTTSSAIPVLSFPSDVIQTSSSTLALTHTLTVPSHAILPFACPTPRPLSHLVLSRNKFMSVGVLPLVSFLGSGYPLHYLSVADCGIGTGALSLILAALQTNPYLNGIDLRHNYGFRYQMSMGCAVEEKYGGDSTYYSIHPSLNTHTLKSLISSAYSSAGTGAGTGVGGGGHAVKTDANVNILAAETRAHNPRLPVLKEQSYRDAYVQAWREQEKREKSGKRDQRGQIPENSIGNFENSWENVDSEDASPSVPQVTGRPSVYALSPISARTAVKKTYKSKKNSSLAVQKLDNFMDNLFSDQSMLASVESQMVAALGEDDGDDIDPLLFLTSSHSYTNNNPSASMGAGAGMDEAGAVPHVADPDFSVHRRFGAMLSKNKSKNSLLGAKHASFSPFTGAGMSAHAFEPIETAVVGRDGDLSSRMLAKQPSLSSFYTENHRGNTDSLKIPDSFSGNDDTSALLASATAPKWIRALVTTLSYLHTYKRYIPPLFSAYKSPASVVVRDVMRLVTDPSMQVSESACDGDIGYEGGGGDGNGRRQSKYGYGYLGESTSNLLDLPSPSNSPSPLHSLSPSPSRLSLLSTSTPSLSCSPSLSSLPYLAATYLTACPSPAPPTRMHTHAGGSLNANGQYHASSTTNTGINTITSISTNAASSSGSAVAAGMSMGVGMGVSASGLYPHPASSPTSSSSSYFASASPPPLPSSAFGQHDLIALAYELYAVRNVLLAHELHTVNNSLSSETVNNSLYGGEKHTNSTPNISNSSSVSSLFPSPSLASTSHAALPPSSALLAFEECSISPTSLVFPPLLTQRYRTGGPLGVWGDSDPYGVWVRYGAANIHEHMEKNPYLKSHGQYLRKSMENDVFSLNSGNFTKKSRKITSFLRESGFGNAVFPGGDCFPGFPNATSSSLPVLPLYSSTSSSLFLPAHYAATYALSPDLPYQYAMRCSAPAGLLHVVHGCIGLGEGGVGVAGGSGSGSLGDGDKSGSAGNGGGAFTASMGVGAPHLHTHTTITANMIPAQSQVQAQAQTQVQVSPLSNTRDAPASAAILLAPGGSLVDILSTGIPTLQCTVSDTRRDTGSFSLQSALGNSKFASNMPCISGYMTHPLPLLGLGFHPHPELSLFSGSLSIYSLPDACVVCGGYRRVTPYSDTSLSRNNSLYSENSLYDNTHLLKQHDVWYGVARGGDSPTYHNGNSGSGSDSVDRTGVDLSHTITTTTTGGIHGSDGGMGADTGGSGKRSDPWGCYCDPAFLRDLAQLYRTISPRSLTAQAPPHTNAHAAAHASINGSGSGYGSNAQTYSPAHSHTQGYGYEYEHGGDVAPRSDGLVLAPALASTMPPYGVLLAPLSSTQPQTILPAATTNSANNNTISGHLPANTSYVSAHLATGVGKAAFASSVSRPRHQADVLGNSALHAPTLPLFATKKLKPLILPLSSLLASEFSRTSRKIPSSDDFPSSSSSSRLSFPDVASIASPLGLRLLDLSHTGMLPEAAIQLFTALTAAITAAKSATGAGATTGDSGGGMGVHGDMSGNHRRLSVVDSTMTGSNTHIHTSSTSTFASTSTAARVGSAAMEGDTRTSIRSAASRLRSLTNIDAHQDNAAEDPFNRYPAPLPSNPPYMPLTHLLLSHNNLDDTCMVSLGSYIRMSRTLTHLDISHNNIGDGGSIGKAVLNLNNAGNAGSSTTAGNSKNTGSGSRVARLGLGATSSFEEDTTTPRAYATAIPYNNTSTSTNGGGRGMSRRKMVAAGDGLGRGRGEADVKGGNHDFTDALNTNTTNVTNGNGRQSSSNGGSGAGDGHLIDVPSVLKMKANVNTRSSTNVHIISGSTDTSSNNVSGGGAHSSRLYQDTASSSKKTDYIPHARHLTFLKESNHGIFSLLSACVLSPSLTHLNLSSCSLTDISGLALIVVLTINTHITHVYVGENAFRPETVQVIQKKLRLNRQKRKSLSLRRKLWLWQGLRLHIERMRVAHRKNTRLNLCAGTYTHVHTSACDPCRGPSTGTGTTIGTGMGTGVGTGATVDMCYSSAFSTSSVPATSSLTVSIDGMPTEGQSAPAMARAAQEIVKRGVDTTSMCRPAVTATGTGLPTHTTTHAMTYHGSGAVVSSSKLLSPLSNLSSLSLRDDVYKHLCCQGVALMQDNVYTAIAHLHTTLLRKKQDLHSLRVRLPVVMASEHALLRQLQGVLASTRDRSRAIKRDYASMMLGDVGQAEWREYEREMQALEEDVAVVERAMAASRIGCQMEGQSKAEGGDVGTAAAAGAGAVNNDDGGDIGNFFLTDVVDTKPTQHHNSSSSSSHTSQLSHLAHFPTDSALTQLHQGLHERYLRVSALRARYRAHNDALKDRIRETRVLLEERLAELPKLDAEVHRLEQTLGQMYAQVAEMRVGIQRGIAAVGSLMTMWTNELAVLKGARSSGKGMDRSKRLQDNAALWNLAGGSGSSGSGGGVAVNSSIGAGASAEVDGAAGSVFSQVSGLLIPTPFSTSSLASQASPGLTSPPFSPSNSTSTSSSAPQPFSLAPGDNNQHVSTTTSDTMDQIASNTVANTGIGSGAGELSRRAGVLSQRSGSGNGHGHGDGTDIGLALVVNDDSTNTTNTSTVPAVAGVATRLGDGNNDKQPVEKVMSNGRRVGSTNTTVKTNTGTDTGSSGVHATRGSTPSLASSSSSSAPSSSGAASSRRAKAGSGTTHVTFSTSSYGNDRLGNLKIPDKLVISPLGIVSSLQKMKE